MGNPPDFQFVTYSLPELTDRIEDVTGERPSRNTIYKERSAAERVPNARNRPTAGLPAPVADSVPLQWEVSAVEEWLANHPALRAQTALAQFLTDWDHIPDRSIAVSTARAAGLSWGQLADALTAAGSTISRQALAARYG